MRAYAVELPGLYLESCSLLAQIWRVEVAHHRIKQSLEMRHSAVFGDCHPDRRSTDQILNVNVGSRITQYLDRSETDQTNLNTE